jgi:arylformamidase
LPSITVGAILGSKLASAQDMPQIRRPMLKETPVAAIDYEAEYNNRARVPEHAEIFARWTREAELYRAEMLKNDRAELGLTYGSTLRQSIDLFLAQDDANAPLAIFIHGGWWRSLEPSMFSQMARGPNGRGISVAVVGYDLCPIVSIADIVEQMRRMCAFLWHRFGRRMTVYGHSAGGHLAAALLATDWRALYPKAPADLVPAAYSVSGVFDLTPLLATSVNTDLRLDPAEARKVSPLFWPVAAGRIFDAVVGGLESNEFKRQGRTIAQTWQQVGAQARYEEVAGTNHFTVIDPLSDPQSPMAARIADLAKATAS